MAAWPKSDQLDGWLSFRWITPAARAPSVAVAPGLIEFTRIIFDPNSFASARVIASTALLVAV
jgi:hypothetical protein